MPDSSNEQRPGLEALQSSVEACDEQDKPLVSENERTEYRLELLVADLTELEEMLSVVDSLDQLRSFRDFVESDARIAELKGLAADRQGDLDVFDVLQIHHLEFVHSNFLRWLLSPSENHRLGSHFLQGFLSRTVTAARGQGIPAVPATRIDAMDWSETEVLREWRYIDVTIVNRKESFVCAVENKVWSGEGFGDSGVSQLTAYRETLAREFPDFDSHLVFLSPRGLESRSDVERHFWVTADYVAIQQLVVETLEEKASDINPEVRWFLTQYETTLRRNIVPEDSRIGELARQIYLEHRDVIELINRHKPDYAADVKQILKEAISQQDGWLLDEEGGSYVRFRPSDWDRFESLRTGTGWGQSPSLLLFEFYCPSDPVATAGPALVLGPGSDEVVRQRLFEAARQEPGKFNLRQASLRDGFTHLHEGNRNLLVDSDLGAKWGDGSTRDKLMAWVKRFAEGDFPDINAAVVQCLEEFENAASESEA